jgi:hypothetical protein
MRHLDFTTAAATQGASATDPVMSHWQDRKLLRSNRNSQYMQHYNLGLVELDISTVSGSAI